MACKDNNSRWGEDARCSEGAAHLPQRAGGGGRQQGIPGARDEPDAGELGECYNPRPVPPISVVLDGERAGRETVFRTGGAHLLRSGCAVAADGAAANAGTGLQGAWREEKAGRRSTEKHGEQSSFLIASLWHHSSP